MKVFLDKKVSKAVPLYRQIIDRQGLGHLPVEGEQLPKLIQRKTFARRALQYLHNQSTEPHHYKGRIDFWTAESQAVCTELRKRGYF